MNIDHDLLNVIFEGAMSVIGFFVVSVMKEIKKSIDETKQSVDALNVKVATVIEKTSNHEKTLDQHSEQIFELQKVRG